MRMFATIDRVAIFLSVSAVIAIMSITCISVVGRYFFNSPIPDDLSISEKLMVVLVFLPLAAVQASREHVFVTVFSEWMPNRAKLGLETFGIFVGCVFFGVLSAATWVDFYDAFGKGSYTQGPLNIVHWPFKFVLWVGITLFFIRLVYDFVISLIGLATGRMEAAKSEEDRVLDIEVD